MGKLYQLPDGNWMDLEHVTAVLAFDAAGDLPPRVVIVFSRDGIHEDRHVIDFPSNEVSANFRDHVAKFANEVKLLSKK